MIVQFFSVLLLAIASFFLGVFYRNFLRIEDEKLTYDERIENLKKEINAMIKAKHLQQKH